MNTTKFYLELNEGYNCKFLETLDTRNNGLVQLKCPLKTINSKKIQPYLGRLTPYLERP